MLTPITDRYPRTLYEWLKTEDRALTKAIAEGLVVAEAAEQLQREPISLVRRIAHLGLLELDEFSEEWAEAMGMVLGGVPLDTAIDWCSGSESRLPLELIEAMVGSDLRAEFSLARHHHLTVANCDALNDLVWLQAQPTDVQGAYAAACGRLLDAFDVLTPSTLRAVVMGTVSCVPGRITVHTPHRRSGRGFARSWSSSAPTRTVRTGRSYAKKRYARMRRQYAR